MRKIGIGVLALALVSIIVGVVLYGGFSVLKENPPTEQNDTSNNNVTNEDLVDVTENNHDEIYEEQCIDGICYQIDSLAFSDSSDYDMGELVMTITNNTEAVVPAGQKKILLHSADGDITVYISYDEIAVGETQQTLSMIDNSSVVDVTSYDVTDLTEEDYANFAQ